jgi:hypothetical protein
MDTKETAWEEGFQGVEEAETSQKHSEGHRRGLEKECRKEMEEALDFFHKSINASLTFFQVVKLYNQVHIANFVSSVSKSLIKRTEKKTFFFVVDVKKCTFFMHFADQQPRKDNEQAKKLALKRNEIRKRRCPVVDQLCGRFPF